jgi:hypothetical protein
MPNETLYLRRPQREGTPPRNAKPPAYDIPAYAEQNYFILEAYNVKKLLDRRILSLALALIMMVSVFVLTASATDDDPGAEPEEIVGYNPDPYYELLWWQDVDFSVPFHATLWGTTYVTLGYNTIEVFNQRGPYYELGFHPQFFPDYDDQSIAEGILGIDALSVWDGYAYVPIDITGDAAFIPTDYTLYNSDEDIYYLKCQVHLTLVDYIEETKSMEYWSPAYLRIPDEVPPIPSSPEAAGR